MKKVSFHMLNNLFYFIEYGAKYCPELKNPENGTVMLQDKVIAIYACSPPHRLKGPKTRVCNTENGTWQHVEPTCSAGELVYRTSIISIIPQFGKQSPTLRRLLRSYKSWLQCVFNQYTT